jgi:hypothetical protein
MINIRRHEFQLTTFRFSITFFMAGQNSSVKSRCLDLHLKTYVPLGFNIFELEQFTLYGSSTTLHCHIVRIECSLFVGLIFFFELSYQDLVVLKLF